MSSSTFLGLYAIATLHHQIIYNEKLHITEAEKEICGSLKLNYLPIENYNSKEEENLPGNGNNEENAARAWAFAKMESLKSSDL